MRAAFWAALVLGVLVIVEGTSYVIELSSPRLLQEPIRRRAAILRDQTQRIAELLDTSVARRDMIDSLLGWRYQDGFSSASDHINAQGLRSRHQYAPRPRQGILRVAAFGDSFIYGTEVADDDAWASVVEASHRNIEVLNYGVGGYGVDQALLRFDAEGMTFHPDVVLIGFTSDDLRRMVNVYRRFISIFEAPLAKPRFVFGGDRKLVLAPNPLPSQAAYEQLMNHPLGVRKLGALDAWYSPTIYENPLYDYVATLRVAHALGLRLYRRYFDPDRLFRDGIFSDRSAAFALQVAVFEAFADSVRRKDAHPVIVMFPERESVERARAGGSTLYAPLRRTLEKNGIEVWDVADTLRLLPGDLGPYYAAGGHYAPPGNRLVAQWLASRLEALRGQRIAFGR